MIRIRTPWLRRGATLLLLMGLLLVTACSGKDKKNNDKDGDNPPTDKQGNKDNEPGEKEEPIPPSPRSENFVTGKVTLNGQPVAGQVIFMAPDGKEQPPATTNGDGVYYLDDAPAGKYKVFVRPLALKQGAPPKMPELPNAPKRGVEPLKKYAGNSVGLVFEVTKGEQTFDITMKE